jgi:large subunit ribosomal protein L5
MAATKKKPAGNPFGGTTSKKLDLKPEGKRLEDVKDKVTPRPRFEDFYNNEVVPAMMKKYNFKSVMQVPRLMKITLNMGVGEAATDQKLLQSAVNELELIAGQRPCITRSKKAISNFKLRQGIPIGTKVTLRRARMYEFLDRFINITAPRVRDFRGFPDKGFDGRGNFSLGIKEQIIFPEIDVDKVARIAGLDITFVIRSDSDEFSYSLLKEFGFPFRKKD